MLLLRRARDAVAELPLVHGQQGGGGDVAVGEAVARDAGPDGVVGVGEEGGVGWGAGG